MGRRGQSEAEKFKGWGVGIKSTVLLHDRVTVIIIITIIGLGVTQCYSTYLTCAKSLILSVREK